MLTPQTKTKKLAKAVGLGADLYLKREDLHPYGSHKGRSIPPMIEQYRRAGWKNFCISSSGNAALAAAQAIFHFNKSHAAKLNLKIFVGKNISKTKLGLIKKIANASQGKISFSQVGNPKQAAFQMEKNTTNIASGHKASYTPTYILPLKGGGRGRGYYSHTLNTEAVKNLRQSVDDMALIGYETLAKELSKIKKMSAVFIPTSSGTTTQGLYMAFKKIGIKPQIHVVQTQACHPMVQSVNLHHPPPASQARALRAGLPPPCLACPSGRRADRQAPEGGGLHTTKQKKMQNSIASAIVDKVARRKANVTEAIKNNGGGGWIANDAEIRQAIAIIKKTEKVNASPNSALSVAGLILAIKNNRQFNGPVVCLLTGR